MHHLARLGLDATKTYAVKNVSFGGPVGMRAGKDLGDKGLDVALAKYGAAVLVLE